MTLNYLYIVVLLQNCVLSSFGHNTVVMKLFEADEVNVHYLDFALLSHDFMIIQCDDVQSIHSWVLLSLLSYTWLKR